MIVEIKEHVFCGYDTDTYNRQYRHVTYNRHDKICIADNGTYCLTTQQSL